MSKKRITRQKCQKSGLLDTVSREWGYWTLCPLSGVIGNCVKRVGLLDTVSRECVTGHCIKRVHYWTLCQESALLDAVSRECITGQCVKKACITEHCFLRKDNIHYWITRHWTLCPNKGLLESRSYRKSGLLDTGHLWPESGL